jgi:hypothetical protein
MKLLQLPEVRWEGVEGEVVGQYNQSTKVQRKPIWNYQNENDYILI